MRYVFAGVVFACIAFVIFQYFKNNNVKNKPFSYNKPVRWIFGGYTAILLLGAALAWFVPEQGTPTGKRVDSKVLQKETDDLHTSALKGKIDAKWEKKKWNFSYKGKLLNIVVAKGEYSDVMVVAKKDEATGSKIEASFFQTRASLDNRELPTPLAPINLHLSGNKLIIEQRKTQITYAEFSNVFPIKQFTGEHVFQHNASFNEGQSVLYLQIPKGLKLNPQENLNFQSIP